MVRLCIEKCYGYDRLINDTIMLYIENDMVMIAW